MSKGAHSFQCYGSSFALDISYITPIAFINHAHLHNTGALLPETALLLTYTSTEVYEID